ncbi:hypothetical protein DFA_09216 [Cavenderia fasciculata]|uniref:Methyltransferase type 11 domain-containing protein n=1 Tax=Cavenderia fasciculata TaxID=261658 RepID=F4Q706_CACFS|nr:uncharacterized protein DFA_09216 [Cavenderia fasciculata]EGG16188.1 hypothetical protein DFA_09216 [Cavenderia fasciculata]|eukprot:XP_004354572.1 hypothetical protein DFA_09216 [Cavenderia fasciculata]
MTTSSPKMSKQNIYDSKEFFDGYAKMDRSVKGAAGICEWDSTIKMLDEALQSKHQPTLESVVDLGCGYGWFSGYLARERHVKSIKAYDLSVKMLDRAKQLNQHEESIEYAQADLETIKLPPLAFDLAFSSLTLHYIVNLSTLLDTVYASVKPGGHFIVIIEHPIYSAPTIRNWINNNTQTPTDPNQQQEEEKETLGYKQGEERLVWPLYNYQMEGDRIENWIVKGVVKQHRTISSYINHFINVGFNIRKVEEFTPSPDQIKQVPSLAIEAHRPMFLMISLQKPIN